MSKFNIWWIFRGNVFLNATCVESGLAVNHMLPEKSECYIVWYATMFTWHNYNFNQ